MAKVQGSTVAGIPADKSDAEVQNSALMDGRGQAVVVADDTSAAGESYARPEFMRKKLSPAVARTAVAPAAGSA